MLSTHHDNYMQFLCQTHGRGVELECTSRNLPYIDLCPPLYMTARVWAGHPNFLPASKTQSGHAWKKSQHTGVLSAQTGLPGCLQSLSRTFVVCSIVSQEYWLFHAALAVPSGCPGRYRTTRLTGRQSTGTSQTITAIPLHVAAGYAVGCMDAAAFAKAPFSARGIRPIGGHETVQTNFSKATTKALGALMEDELVLNFRDHASSKNVMELLEKLRQKYGRVFLICDNARAHKSKKIQEYLGKTRGEVVLWYLPPYTPQHNPIEIVWRELKRAIAGRYFDKFKEMRKTIRRLIKSGEVATVKLLWYMLDAISRGKTLQKAAS